MWFTDQNIEPLEIEDSVNLAVIIGIKIKIRYSTEPKYRKTLKDTAFYHL